LAYAGALVAFLIAVAAQAKDPPPRYIPYDLVTPPQPLGWGKDGGGSNSSSNGGTLDQGRRTGKAPDSNSNPDLEKLAKNPVVSAGIDKAWKESRPPGGGPKLEHGFWIIKDPKTGAISLLWFPMDGATKSKLIPGATPPNAIAFFHTHPNAPTEDAGWETGPSPADQNFAKGRGLPGIIQSTNGMYYFGP
jgi:hypothetical protein